MRARQKTYYEFPSKAFKAKIWCPEGKTVRFYLKRTYIRRRLRYGVTWMEKTNE